MSSNSGPGDHQRPYPGITPAPGAPNLYTKSSATGQTTGLFSDYPGHQHLSGNRYTPQQSGLPNGSPAGMGSNYQFNFNPPPGMTQWPLSAAGYDLQGSAHFAQPHLNPYTTPTAAFPGSGHALAYDGYHPSQSSVLKREREELQERGTLLIQNLKASPFWHQHVQIQAGYDLQSIAGTPAALWNQGGDVQCAIMEKFVTFYGNRALSFVTPRATASPNVLQGLTDNDIEDDDDLSDTPSKKRKVSPKSSKKPPQKKTPKNKSSQKASKKRAKEFPPPPCAEYGKIAAYTQDPDLATEADCWNLLLFPVDVEPIEPIDGDDWQDIRDNRVQEFIGKIYNALLHPHKADPTSYDFMKNKTINAEKYKDGQEDALKQVGYMLGTPARAKEVRALCNVLVNRVIRFHSEGLIKRKKNAYDWYVKEGRKIQRPYRTDFRTICSVRLEMIVDAVKDNKRIALDVVSGENRDKIAEDPEEYLRAKFNMADSNNKRQDKVDQANQMQVEIRSKATNSVQKKAKPTAARRKQKGKVPSDEESEEVDEHEAAALGIAIHESLQPRAARSKKVQRDLDEHDGDDEDDGFIDEVPEEEFEDQFAEEAEEHDEDEESDEEYEPST